MLLKLRTSFIFYIVYQTSKYYSKLSIRRPKHRQTIMNEQIQFAHLITSISPDTPIDHIQYAENTLRFLYNYPQRHYHNWSHIENCLTELSEIQELIDTNTIALSIFYHDCMYKPIDPNNELRSAETAFINLLALGFSESFARNVYNHILLTTHKIPANTLSEQILLDIDLSILGKDPITFASYESNIRSEFDFIPTDDYLIGRIMLLHSFRKKDRIYLTNHFYDKYEDSAWDNLTQTIENQVSEIKQIGAIDKLLKKIQNATDA